MTAKSPLVPPERVAKLAGIMAYELEGSLKEIFETKTFAKGFTKREFVVTVASGPDDKWPQHVKLQCVKDRCATLDKFKAGQRVKVSFDLRGSEYQGRYYTDLQAFKIEASGAGAPASSDEPPLDEPPAGYGTNYEDDIPF